MKNFRRTLGLTIITLLTFVPFVTPAVASTPTQQVGTVSIRVAPYLNGDVKNFAYINANMPNKPYDGCMLYVYVDLPGGGGWDQDISSVGETEIEVTGMGGSPVGAINITVRKKCPKVDIVVASARPLVVFAQEIFPENRLWPDSASYGDGSRQKIVSATRTLNSVAVTATLTKNGKIVYTQTTVGKLHKFEYIPTRTRTPDGTYVLTVQTPGLVSTQNVIDILWGWSNLGESFGSSEIDSWDRCETITWNYYPQGQPRTITTAQMAQDLKTMFDIASKTTGLTFKQVGPNSVAKYNVNWSETNSSGTGTLTYLVANGVRSHTAELRLNPTDGWARTPGWGAKGHGSLLLHEMGHTLGLGHVSNQTALMTTIHHFTATGSLTANSYSAGEQAGLRYLYQPQTCPGWKGAQMPAPAPVTPQPSQPQNIKMALFPTYARITWAPPTDYPAHVRLYKPVQILYDGGGLILRPYATLGNKVYSYNVPRTRVKQTVTVHAGNGAGDSNVGTLLTIPAK